MKLSATTFRRTVVALVSASLICLTVSFYLTVVGHQRYTLEREQLKDISDTINRTSMTLGLSASMPKQYLHQAVDRIISVLEKHDEMTPAGKWRQLHKLIDNALTGVTHYKESLAGGHSQEYLDHLHIQAIMLLNLIIEEQSRLSQDLSERQANDAIINITVTAALCVLLSLVLLGAHLVYQKVLFRPIIDAARRVQSGKMRRLVPRKGLAVKELSALLGALEKAWRELEREATHDSLTGLPNRLHFTRKLETACTTMAETGKAVAVMMIDLDDFKEVNDTMGHPAGDTLLKGVAERLTDILSGSGSLARLGGDEFAILLERLDSGKARRKAKAVSRTIREAFGEPFLVNGQTIVAHLSIGVAVAPEGGYERSILLRNADIALYRAKGRKRGGVAFYAEEMSREIADNLRIENEIRNGLAAGEFFFLYQPKMDTRDDRIIGLEALIRWQHPRRGLLEPDSFLPQATRSGLMHQISDYVLKTVVADMGAWRKQGRPLPIVSINIDPKFLRSGDVCRKITALCLKHEVQPWNFCIEITEGTFFNYSQKMEGILAELRHLGVRLSIDDFGTGYSSLRYIQKMPVDEIKIDRSFVRDVTGPEVTSPVLEAIISLANGYGIAVVAEGVETRDQLAYLQKHSCHVIQGYLTGRPMKADELAWTRVAAALPVPIDHPAFEKVTLLRPKKRT